MGVDMGRPVGQRCQERVGQEFGTRIDQVQIELCRARMRANSIPT